jgi:hypothetical protein
MRLRDLRAFSLGLVSQTSDAGTTERYAHSASIEFE